MSEDSDDGYIEQIKKCERCEKPFTAWFKDDKICIWCWYETKYRLIPTISVFNNKKHET